MRQRVRAEVSLTAVKVVAGMTSELSCMELVIVDIARD